MPDNILKRFEIELPLADLKNKLVSLDDEPALFTHRYDILLENLNKIILSLKKKAGKVPPAFITSLHNGAEDLADIRRHRKWIPLTVKIAFEIAKWWKPDFNNHTDWIDWFRPLSHAFVDVLESRPNYFLQEAHQDFEQFYITYLKMCLQHKREDIIPEILSIIQGRKLAAFFQREREQSLGNNAITSKNLNSTDQNINTEVLGIIQQTRAALRRLSRELPKEGMIDQYLSVNLGTLQTKLQSDEALLLLVDSTNKETREALALIITQQTHSIINLRGLSELSQFTSQYGKHRGTIVGMRSVLSLKENQEQTTDESIKTLTEFKDEMGKLLWQPLSKHLKNIHHLHVVTDGKLHVLLYELGAPEGLTFNNYPGLVFYNQLRHRDADKTGHTSNYPNADTPLGIQVDDAEDYPNWETIPLVNAEANMVQTIWQNATHSVVDVEKGELAVAFLHLSGHGKQDTKDPTNASVLLGRELGLQHILHSPLQPRVVFLSACVVGRTKEDSEGDPLGLVSAFFMRRAEYVIAALIPVPDFYMPLLAVLFHQAWQQGHRPESALAEAKRRLELGEWYENTESIVREGYRYVLVAHFKKTALAKDTTRLKKLLTNWPFPQKYHNMNNMGVKKLVKKLQKEKYCNDVVNELLDNLCYHKADLDMGDFYTCVRGFGFTGK